MIVFSGASIPDNLILLFLILIVSPSITKAFLQLLQRNILNKKNKIKKL